MKCLVTILAVILVVLYQVDALQEEGDVNINIAQHVVFPTPPDVDECVEDIHSCAANELCVNTPGSYRCVCADGFEKVKGVCEDIDECLEKCDVNGVCVNKPGTFTCHCDEGFEEVDGFCEDINECSADINLCGDYGTCENNPGNYSCKCQEGFEINGGTCTDIDECEDDICGANAVCTNSPGSYTCRCKSLYIDIGNGCEGCLGDFDSYSTGFRNFSTPFYPENYPEDLTCGFKLDVVTNTLITIADVTVEVVGSGMIHDSSINGCETSADHLQVNIFGEINYVCGNITGRKWTGTVSGTVSGTVDEKAWPGKIKVLFTSNSSDGATAMGFRLKVTYVYHE